MCQTKISVNMCVSKSYYICFRNKRRLCDNDDKANNNFDLKIYIILFISISIISQ